MSPGVEPEPDVMPAGGSWIATNLKPITVLGVPAIVMGFLVYWLTMDIAGRLQRIEDTVRSHDRTLIVNLGRMDAYLYSVCLSVAQTEVDRARCAIAHTGGAERETAGAR